MRKIVSVNFDTVHVPALRDEASFESDEKRKVVEMYSTARVQAQGVKKRIIRDRTDRDHPGLVPYVYISSECYTQDEAWKQALEGVSQQLYESKSQGAQAWTE